MVVVVERGEVGERTQRFAGGDDGPQTYRRQNLFESTSIESGRNVLSICLNQVDEEKELPEITFVNDESRLFRKDSQFKNILFSNEYQHYSPGFVSRNFLALQLTTGK